MNIDNALSTPANILIVDDKPENVKLLLTLLRKQGYKVRGVTSGKMALQAVKHMPPHLILLDVMMPKMDGYEVCRRLKEMPETSDIPVIFLSALEKVEDKVKAFEVGAIDYVAKPFELAEISMRVKTQLNLLTAQSKVKQLNEELEEKVRQRTEELEKEIQEHKQTQKILRQMAFYDCLTGLPNRSFFTELLQKAIQRAQRRDDYIFSILFLDCDRFKLVNDSFGHQIGDQILKEVSERLKICLRSIDTIARLGGDEFVILLEELEHVNFATEIAQRLIEELELPFMINNREIYLGISVGIILDGSSYSSSELIMRDADTAMYRAKELGKGCYQIFKPEMHKQARQNLLLETDLRQALKQEEFVVYYQPIFSLTSKSIKGFEALVRWNHSEKGLLSPGYFISMAEETGLIVPLGIWVLREACYQLKQWQQKYLAKSSLTMNVNLSVRQFNNPHLIKEIDAILAETQIESHCLNMEITETALMQNNELAKNMLKELKKRNIGLTIDDFGTGYSSLSYLHNFPVDQLKIDRSFINRIENENDSVNIIHTIISLAKNMHMELVAEGVETEQQLKILTDMGCEYAQGYLFSKPLPSDLVNKMFYEQKATEVAEDKLIIKTK